MVDQQSIVGFFCGREHGGICGARMMIKLKENLSYRLRMGIGRGTNTKAELLALWGLLRFAQDKELHELLILGDS